MSTTRADFFKQIIQPKRDTFSDFFTNFAAHPVTGNLGRITDAAAIKQSLKNLIYTNYGERLYQPNIGSNVLASLFELDDIFIADDLKYAITKTITDHEPRVSLEEVRVQTIEEQNYLAVTIVFSIINISESETLNITLQRAR